ncbi:hypothetical protein NJC38_17285 [Pseudomonas sp. 21LCFQ010]|uniref:hypothetical protein n=1 Tax=Pseudomonas sp. 21LCFQ010 TaxID=2957506 RepID=UPI00209794C4|nr:hypothetical protein [Pseudomonas sp. 21LCFQ010]MCO8163910.1 hypothetical protein [Pseudomonas sp. 21LCFQ010]
MGILLLLPFLVSGYWICLKHPRLALSFHRYEGQLLYLLVAREGIICFLIASVLSLLLGLLRYVSFTVPGCNGGYPVSLDYLSSLEAWLVDHQLSSVHNADIGAFLVQAAVLCLVVPKFWASFAEWRLKRTYNLGTRAELDMLLLTHFVASNPRLDLLLTSIRHPQNKYLFTMQDRKVYVGSVISFGQVTEAQGVDQHFLLVPFLSGYRDKDTLQVEMTTDYANGEYSVIMLAQENIASVMLWKQDVWEAFKTAREAKKPKSRVKDSLPKRN